MKFLIKFTSRSRPEKFFKCLDNITEKAGNEDYVILCSFDVDDPTTANKEVRDRLKNYDKVIPYWGFSDSKIDAINRDVQFVNDWDCLINMSDDMCWIGDNFLSQIQFDIRNNFTGTDFFLHYPDGFVNERLATMSIIGRSYFDRFGWIYNPEYKSLYCDQEAQEVAKKLGKYKFINKSLFIHAHPAWGQCEMDEQYKHTESFYEEDRATFLERQKNNFYL